MVGVGKIAGKSAQLKICKPCSITHPIIVLSLGRILENVVGFIDFLEGVRIPTCMHRAEIQVWTRAVDLGPNEFWHPKARLQPQNALRPISPQARQNITAGC